MSIPLTPTDLPLMAPASSEDSPRVSGPGGSSPSRGRVIEFYVPTTFRLPARRWISPEARGKLIEFPGRGVRKSRPSEDAHDDERLYDLSS